MYTTPISWTFLVLRNWVTSLNTGLKCYCFPMAFFIPFFLPESEQLVGTLDLCACLCSSSQETTEWWLTWVWLTPGELNKITDSWRHGQSLEACEEEQCPRAVKVLAVLCLREQGQEDLLEFRWRESDREAHLEKTVTPSKGKMNPTKPTRKNSGEQIPWHHIPPPLYPLPSLPLVEPNFIQPERKPQVSSSGDRAWWKRVAGRSVGQSVSRFTTAKLAALGCLSASRLHWVENCPTQSFLHHGLTMTLRYSVPCTPHRCEFSALELRTGLS